MEQMMCSSGYSDQFTGLATSLFLFCGTFAAVPVTLVMAKCSNAQQRELSLVKNNNHSISWWASCISNPSLAYTKGALALGGASTIGMLLLAQVPNQQVSQLRDNYLISG